MIIFLVTIQDVKRLRFLIVGNLGPKKEDCVSQTVIVLNIMMNIVDHLEYVK